MLSRFILLLSLVAVAQGGPITWSLNNAVFGDGGTAVGSFVFDATTQTVLSYSIQTSQGSNPAFPGFLYQDGAPGNTGVFTSTMGNFILFETSFTNGNPNGIELRLAPLSGLTNAGGVVALGTSSVECYNCDPFRTFVSGQMVAEGVPEPATALLVLIPLAGGVLIRRRLGEKR